MTQDAHEYMQALALANVKAGAVGDCASVLLIGEHPQYGELFRVIPSHKTPDCFEPRYAFTRTEIEAAAAQAGITLRIHFREQPVVP